MCVDTYYRSAIRRRPDRVENKKKGERNQRFSVESAGITNAKQGDGSTREKKTTTGESDRAGIRRTRTLKHVNPKKGRRDHKSQNRWTYPINISLLLCKAEMGQTLVLDFPQEIVLEERLDPCVLVRLAVRILLPQPLNVLPVQQTGREVLGAGPHSGLLGAMRVGGERWGVGGIVCDLLSLVLRRTGSGTAFSIHNEICPETEEVVGWVTKESDGSRSRGSYG